MRVAFFLVPATTERGKTHDSTNAYQLDKTPELRRDGQHAAKSKIRRVSPDLQ